GGALGGVPGAGRPVRVARAVRRERLGKEAGRVGGMGLNQSTDFVGVCCPPGPPVALDPHRSRVTAITSRARGDDGRCRPPRVNGFYDFTPSCLPCSPRRFCPL